MSKKNTPKIDRWTVTKIKSHVSTDEVKTKPSQAMSVREMLFRNTQGMAYDNYKTPYYEEQATFSSDSLNKIQDMEPVEKLQYLNTVTVRANDLKKKIEEHEQAKAEALAQQQQPTAPEGVVEENVVAGTE